MDWAARDRRVLWHPFTAHDEWDAQPMLVVERAEGVWLIDAEGRRYLDGTSSLWCSVHGHRHPHIDAAIREQLDRMAHSTMLGLSHPPAVLLAERLCALTGLDRVFYSDSGSTAVEVALKMAFQCQQQRGERRTRFAALTDAYHGDTLGSVSVGGIDLFHAVYRPLLFSALRIPTPGPDDEATCLERAEALFRANGHELAAFVFEPLVQGAAGMRLHSPDFLRSLCAMAHDAGALLVADEVATGFGRTGTMFAVEQVGVKPDLLCLAKGMSGGYLPLAATLATEAIFEAFRGGSARTFFHGHTYTGNALACAAALASLEVFDDDNVLASLPAKIAALREELAVFPEARQCGLMAAAIPAIRPPEERAAHRIALACRNHGVVLRSLGDAVVLMPPLAMTPDQIRTCVRALLAATRDVLG